MWFPPSKMKRKDLDDASDEFPEFSSPARKSRRLDLEFPPIMEGGDSGGGDVSVHKPNGLWQHAAQAMDGSLRSLQESKLPSIMDGGGCAEFPMEFDPLGQQVNSLASGMDAVLESVPEFPPSTNEERALVLYKPVVDSQFLIPPASPNISVTVIPSLISGFSSHHPMFWQRNPSPIVAEEPSEREKPDAASDNRLALVPWVVPHVAVAGAEERMEEGGGIEAMDIEEDVEEGKEQAGGGGGIFSGEVLQQWHQQHCTSPQMNTSTPTQVMWSM